ncbi:hypothetical protein HI914_02011 [Erysiphe necator]|nr:hypothetical protein HI914_02011 [Erysiphe necator]
MTTEGFHGIRPEAFQADSICVLENALSKIRTNAAMKFYYCIILNPTRESPLIWFPYSYLKMLKIPTSKGCVIWLECGESNV